MIKSNGNKRIKLLFISASGGHLDELMMLSKLMEKYPSIIVTEKTKIETKANYFMIQSGAKQKPVIGRLVLNFFVALWIFIKERPTHVVSTGGVIAVPFVFFMKLTKNKIIFIETIAKVQDASRTGKFMYKHADLFIVQWESLLKVYPKAIYGGSLF